MISRSKSKEQTENMVSWNCVLQFEMIKLWYRTYNQIKKMKRTRKRTGLENGETKDAILSTVFPLLLLHRSMEHRFDVMTLRLFWKWGCWTNKHWCVLATGMTNLKPFFPPSNRIQKLPTLIIVLGKSEKESRRNDEWWRKHLQPHSKGCRETTKTC